MSTCCCHMGRIACFQPRCVLDWSPVSLHPNAHFALLKWLLFPSLPLELVEAVLLLVFLVFLPHAHCLGCWRCCCCCLLLMLGFQVSMLPLGLEGLVTLNPPVLDAPAWVSELVFLPAPLCLVVAHPLLLGEIASLIYPWSLFCCPSYPVPPEALWIHLWEVHKFPLLPG